MAATTGSPRIRALAAALRQAREGAGVGVREVARRMGIQHSTVSYWETGRRSPRIEDVGGYLVALGVSGDERERILNLARDASEASWLTVGVPGMTNGLAGVLECERTAETITDWSPLVVPGLLQTWDYSRAIIGAYGASANDVEPRVLLRAGRREILTKSNPVRLHALIGEAALYLRVGGNGIHADQLRHLHKSATQADNITVQVVRTALDWHPGVAGPFVLYEFPGAPPIVHLEHHRSSAFLYDEDDLAEYRSAADSLRKEVAMSPNDSLELIADVITELETTS
ncbi:MAG: helix-turn-helix domain-containing protein [Pseudonocardiaceae bacterium]|nr:helix-turn-helix domain-containing protein [Pseudonocardiaceae bacterium]